MRPAKHPKQPASRCADVEQTVVHLCIAAASRKAASRPPALWQKRSACLPAPADQSASSSTSSAGIIAGVVTGVAVAAVAAGKCG